MTEEAVNVVGVSGDTSVSRFRALDCILIELLCYHVTLIESPHVIDSTQKKLKSAYTHFNFFKKMT